MAAAAAVEQKYISQNGENSICKCSPDEEASREIYQRKLALSFSLSLAIKSRPADLSVCAASTRTTLTNNSRQLYYS